MEMNIRPIFLKINQDPIGWLRPMVFARSKSNRPRATVQIMYRVTPLMHLIDTLLLASLLVRSD